MIGKDSPGKARYEKVVSLNRKILEGRIGTNVKKFVRTIKQNSLERTKA